MNVLNPKPTGDLAARIAQHLTYTIGKDQSHASTYDWRMAVSYAVRDVIVDSWFADSLDCPTLFHPVLARGH